MGRFADQSRQPDDPLRDRFIFSKGHAATALYTTLAARGFFPLSWLDTIAQRGSPLAEQPAPHCAPGVELATGSLGHGLPVGVGMALAARIQRQRFRVFVLMSDGECNEGSVWEAAMFAPGQKLDQLAVIVDYNKWQATGRSNEIMALPSLRDKFAAFGWDAVEVDGHNISQIIAALKKVEAGGGKPIAIVAHTTKGKGVSFMEDDNNWHYRSPPPRKLRRRKKELWAHCVMRNAFAKKITELARQDPRLVLLSGDIGNRLFDNLKAKCPERFFNCGVAEANMIGMAAGMAMSGLRPFCYTIAPFITYRCMEQIRVDVCYHHVPVVIVGTGSGLSYAGLGATHHSCEEMGMLRLLPGLAVVAPADDMEVRGALAAALAYSGPVYIRIGKKGEPAVHAAEPEFVIGKAILMRERKRRLPARRGNHHAGRAGRGRTAGPGRRLRLCGQLPHHQTAGCEIVGGSLRQIQARRHHRGTQPLGRLGRQHRRVEGRGGAAGRLLRFGCADEFLHETCEQDEAREHFGLTAEAIASRVRQSLAQDPAALAHAHRH